MCHLAFCIRAILELEVLPLDGDGVVEEELRDAFENLWENIPREVLIQRIRGVGEQEGDVLEPGSREDGGESGEGRFGTDVDARYRAIDKSENSSDGVNDLLEEFVFMNIAGVRRVENANLERGYFSS